MRKLTVRNFSVIKEAELDFGKITVLIGPQSSGKSLLCKLAFFFQQVVEEQAGEAIKASEEFEKFRNRLNDVFFNWFGYDSTSTQTSKVDYCAGSYKVSLTLERRGQPGGARIQWDFSPEIEESYKQVWEELSSEKQRRESLPNPKYFAEEIRGRLSALRGEGAPEIYSYIPSTRSFFLTMHRAIYGTAGRQDDIQIRFSQDFNYGFESSVPEVGLNHPLTQWINKESERILQGKIVGKGSDFQFKSSDGGTLSLSVLSSGTQELLPLITCLREYVAASAAVATTLNLQRAIHKRLFFLEEPESNVFPSTQYELVRIFARMANEPALDAHWVITTHSPYILTAFNNLIEAGQAARNNPALHDEVAKIIPEQYWIKEGDFKAYAIEDGKLRSILNESGFIEGNYLDQVSEVIGNEFDKLLRLEYEHTKAS
ncbi:MAG: AAA family ATPase [Terracidiphilus sp.]|jgi:energy-coupling factor transporter ATP-binding protein EcfA2